MSRTVQDLIEALSRDDETPIDPVAVFTGALRRGRARRHRRRVMATVAGAGLATALLAALPMVVPLVRTPAGPGVSVTPSTSVGPSTTAPPPSLPRRARPVMTTTLRPGATGEWRIVPFTTGDWVQAGYVRRADQLTWVDTVEVYEPGAFDPGQMLTGAPTTVGGHAGFSRYIHSRPTIAWQYGTDAWAVVRGEAELTPSSAVPDALRQIAEAVVIGEPQPIRLPFHMGHLPEALHVVAAGVYSQDHPYAGLEFDRDARPYPDWSDPMRYRWLPLSVQMQESIPAQWHADTTVAGVPAMRNGTSVIIQRDGYWLTIGSGDKVEPLSDQELAWIFTGLTIADWHNSTTWFDTAYP